MDELEMQLELGGDHLGDASQCSQWHQWHNLSANSQAEVCLLVRTTFHAHVSSVGFFAARGLVKQRSELRVAVPVNV